MSGQHSRLNGNERRSTLRRRPLLDLLEGRVVLTTFNVNTTLDTVAVNLHNGHDSTGHVSLRSAIMAADALGGTNTINLPSGTFNLTIAGADEDSSATGDLDLRGTITIKGQNTNSTVIDGNNIDRVLEVISGNINISNLTIQHGRVLGAGGGGIAIDSGTVHLSSVQIQNNQSIGIDGLDGINGGAGVAGGTGGFGTAGEGGGIFNGGTLTLANSSVLSNQALGGAGGNGGNGGFAAGANGASGFNGQLGTGGNGGAGGFGGDALGGGIFNKAGAHMTIKASAISGNRAIGGLGGVGGSGAIGLGGTGGGSSTHVPGNGGDGVGGSGGVGGQGGQALGGGIMNRGTLSFNGGATAITSNFATGGGGFSGGSGANGVGGNGGTGAFNGENGGNGGSGFAGNGAVGGAGGVAEGGGVFNGTNAKLTSTAALNFISNIATGGRGGLGGAGGFATGGRGGDGGPIQGSNFAEGGLGEAGAGGTGGFAGLGLGGGLFNNTGGTVTFKPPTNSNLHPTSTFTGNQAVGGLGGNAGNGGAALGGRGGDGLGNLGGGAAGAGGAAVGGRGGRGGAGASGQGGAIANKGTASFTGVTLDIITNNIARGGFGGNGGNAGNATGGTGGNGTHGGAGGESVGGNGGFGGIGGSGFGGGIFQGDGTLLLAPRKGVPSSSPQSKATDLIQGNFALLAEGGFGGHGGRAILAPGGTPNGPAGRVVFGADGLTGNAGVGVGGGVSIVAPATIDNTTITGNKASTQDDNVSGTFTT